jgi:MerR family copper efflux transcriptional regulator
MSSTHFKAQSALRTMNISQFAKSHGVTSDTVRYYEKQGLLHAPARQGNGYRSYTPAHAEMLRFVRGAQSLGFSLTEIREIVPQLAQGAFGRIDIEQKLQAKMGQIDAHIRQLQILKKELKGTMDSLTCSPSAALSTGDGTAQDSGSGAGLAVTRKSFTKPRSKPPACG